MSFLSYLVKNSMNQVSVVRILAMKWYLMRMGASCVPCERLPAWTSVASYTKYEYGQFARDDLIRNKWMQLSTVNKILYKTLLTFDYKHLISLKKDIWEKIWPSITRLNGQLYNKITVTVQYFTQLKLKRTQIKFILLFH